MSAFWGRAYPSSEESVMDNINDIIAAIEEPPETFEEYLTRYAAQVGTLVNSYIPQGSHPDMDRYLYEPLNAYSQNGGKRHRPLICFAACRAVGGDMARATSAAAAIEHFHTAALIHDDIADGEDEKRLKGRSADGGRGGGIPRRRCCAANDQTRGAFAAVSARRGGRELEPSPLAPALRRESFAVAF